MQKYAIIGFPLGHSYSPAYFNTKFEQECIDAEFIKIEIENVEDLIGVLKNDTSIKGFCVTIPHKQNIIPLLDEISEEAAVIGAVNCVTIRRREESGVDELYLKGYNTDVLGFKRSLLDFLGGELIKDALILGNGGAAKAVRYALSSLNINSITVTRSPLCDQEISYDKVGDYMSSHRLIINTTPLGTFPDVNDGPCIPYDLLSKEHYVYDLIYNPEITKFLHLSQDQGAYICNGHAMLIGQAEENWKLWNL